MPGDSHGSFAAVRMHIAGARSPSPYYIGGMTREQVKEILDRVLTWPPERQENAARILTQMEEQEASPYRLTDEQLKEVERRRADFSEGKEQYATDVEMTSLWKKCGL
jgi:hypothetical protein